MESRNMHEGSAADGTADQSRREALKKFGRYAAVAPAAMMLLEPREGHAGKKSIFGRGKILGGGKGRGRGKGRNGHY
jgi:hypothetical protein